MKRKKNKLLYKIWWICKISIFIVLGDVLLFWTFDLDLFRDHGIENMSAVIAVFIGGKYFVAFLSFWYIIITAGVGLVCMDQWEQEFVKRLFPIKNRVIKWFYAPELMYIIFLLIFIHDFLWTGILAMLCYSVANYLSAICFNNAYNANQPRFEEWRRHRD